MGKRAGVITIDIDAKTQKFVDSMKVGKDAARDFGTSAGKSIDGLSGQTVKSLAKTSEAIHQTFAGDNAKKVERFAAIFGSATVAARHGAEAFGALAASHVAAAGGLAKFTASAASSVSTTDQLTNAYRALRLAISPTIFTSATLAAGVLVEETIRLTNARAKLIDQQSQFAASNKISFQSVDAIDTASRISGKNGNDVRGLYKTLQSRGESDPGAVNAGLAAIGVTGSLSDPATLGKIAAGFAAIEDPVDRAKAAVSIFGESSATALRELDATFSSGTDAVQRYGLALDKLSRTQIYQFRKEFTDLKSTLTDFSSLTGWWESVKQGSEIVAAALEDMTRRGLHSLDDLIGHYIPGLQALRASLDSVQKLPDKAGPQAGFDETNRKLLADDLFAQSTVSRGRRRETLEGQKDIASDAERRSNSAFEKLKTDSEKRYINPKDPTLLNQQQRLNLAVEEQSAGALASATKRKVKAMEDEAAAAKEAEQAAAEIAKILKKTLFASQEGLQKAAEDLNAAGKSPAERTRIEAEAAGRRAVAKANEQLSEKVPGASLSSADSSRVKIEEKSKIFLEREAQWRRDMKATSDAIRERVRAQELLNFAIGKGYEANRSAKVEGDLIRRFGDDYRKPGAKGERSADVDKARIDLTNEADLQHVAAIKAATEAIGDQIELEERLTAVQGQGAEAIRLETLAVKIQQLIRSGMTGTVREQVVAIEKLAAAQKLNASATRIAQLKEELEDTQRLTAAILRGAEAIRIAKQENAIDKIRSEGDFSAALIGTGPIEAQQRTNDQAKHQKELTEEVGRSTRQYSDQIAHINELIAKTLELKQGADGVKRTAEEQVAIDKELRDLGQEKLKVQRDQLLATGGLKDGLRAFVIDAQIEMKKPGEILFEGLHSALDRVSGELGKLFTGQKSSFGRIFQDLGGQVLADANKSLLKKGIAAAAPHLGIKKEVLDKIFGTGKKPTFAPGDPGHVIVDNLGALTGSQPAVPTVAGSASGSPWDEIFKPAAGFGKQLIGAIPPSIGDSVLSIGKKVLKALFGAGGKGLESVTSAISFPGFAEGGVPPVNSPYLVGEKGPEIRMDGNPGTIIPNGKFGGDTHIYNTHVAAGVNIAQVEAAVRRGSQAAYQSSVQSSAQLADERRKRVPQ
jgi:hypothetical protein